MGHGFSLSGDLDLLHCLDLFCVFECAWDLYDPPDLRDSFDFYVLSFELIVPSFFTPIIRGRITFKREGMMHISERSLGQTTGQAKGSREENGGKPDLNSAIHMLRKWII